MLAEMSASQFADWQRAYNVDPWGDERDDLRMARIVWAALQPHAKRRLRESQFLFKFDNARPTPEEYKRKAMMRYQVIVNAFERRERLDGQADQ